jgi:hypothetical protein
MPVLHRNSLFFMGMGERDTYLVTRVIEDKFIALDKDGQITTWSTMTGTQVGETVKAEIEDDEHNTNFKDFEIFTYEKGK